jgi:hypothetical protein
MWNAGCRMRDARCTDRSEFTVARELLARRLPLLTVRSSDTRAEILCMAVLLTLSSTSAEKTVGWTFYRKVR